MLRTSRLLFPLLVLFLAIARPVAASPTTAEAIPWSDLGARAAAQVQGDELTVSMTEDGARLPCPFQRIDGLASPDGLWLTSTECAASQERFRVTARRVERTEPSTARSLDRSGTVLVVDRVARFVRPGVVEEYSVSPDGVRQDFLVLERAEGTGDLRLVLEVEGARVDAAPEGALLTLAGSDREIAYSRLAAFDANGRPLPAHIEAGATEMTIVVDDTDAAYPLRIDPTFSDADWMSLGTLAGADGAVRAIVVGSGGTIYIGGGFVGLGDQLEVNRVAKWNGSAWSALGAGIGTLPGEAVFALALSGTDLYAGGNFFTAGGSPANGVARWDGSSWSPLGSGISSTFGSTIVLALAVVGTDLYAGGQFDLAGGFPASRIAKWDGSMWTNVGGFGTNLNVTALAVSGTDLYVGGLFTSPTSRIARWDGSAWHSLGVGVNNSVNSITVSGSDVYVGGVFTAAGGAPATRIAKWDGSAWSALGSGMNGTVFALVVSGSDVYAGGQFTLAGGSPANRLAKWDGSVWSAVDGGLNGNVNALAVSGGDILVGGLFTRSGVGTPMRRLAKWDGVTLSALIPSTDVGLDNPVSALAVVGTDLYAGGFFSSAGATTVNNIAKWDGSSWSALGAGTNSQVTSLVASGTDLYVGGFFTSAGGSPANLVAKWDGSAWSALDGGIGPAASLVLGMTMSGSDLYVGGIFPVAGGNPAANVAKWNGVSWSALGAGTDGAVRAIVVSGNDLYVGGDFNNAGGSPASRVAKWDGSAWSPLGSGVDPAFGRLVAAMAKVGSDLYAGGNFTTAGGNPISYIARWDGSAWSSAGTGVDNVVRAMATSGTDLFVGGDFRNAGGAPANRIAKWDGSVWSPLGSGLNNQVAALAISGTDLYVGGTFSAAGGKISAYAAKADLGGAGSIAGLVTADCPAAGSPLLGVHVDLYEVGSGDLVATATTDAAGSYLIEAVPGGDYVVTVVNPLGYTTASLEVPVTVESGGTANANFAFQCQAITANPRSIGFWKHQVGVATGGKGAAQVSAATLCSYLDLIAAHFNSNAINQVIVYVPPGSGTCADKLEVAKQLLNLTGSVAMVDRAKQQLVALLLNVAAGYISQTQVISPDGANVSQAITYCDNVIDNPSGDHEAAKTIADKINNGQSVPAGMVPIGTQVIAYRTLPTETARPALELERVSPNPVRGAFGVSFTLGHGPAWLELIDVAGRRVMRQEVGQFGAGRHRIGMGAGASIPPGIYSLRLSGSGRTLSRTVVVLR